MPERGATAAAANAGGGTGSALLRQLRERLGPLAALCALCLLFGALSPRFFAVDNFLNVARQMSLNGIIAVGMTLVIVSGGIDLSVGSVLALSICASGVLMAAGTHAPAALAVGLATGLACGAVNGALVVRLRITPFIATLGMMSFARGAAMVLTGGNPNARLDRSYFFLGTGSFLGVPVPVWCMLAVAVFGAFLLGRTRFGRYALALGSNEEAVRLAGVSVGRVKMIVYMISGGLAAIAGWILSARVASADPSAGVLMELEAIAAVVIGGASLSGGRGSVTGTLIGAAIMGVLNNGLVLLGIGAFWQQLLVGFVIVAAVAVDQLRSAKRAPNPIVRKVGLAVAAAGVLAALVATVVRSRGAGVAAEGAGGGSGGGGKLVIAVIGKASGGEYWLAVKAGAERKAAELGVDMLWEGTPQETDVAKQIDLVENLVQRGVSGISIAPTDANALSPAIKKALDAKIPVITIDSDSTAKDRLAYVGTDNRLAGEEAGREMLRLTGGKGKVAIITGVLGAQNLRERCAGFKSALAGSGIEVLSEQTDSGDRAKALAAAESLLLANPDLAGFFTDTAISGPSVAQALLARGRTGQVKVVAFDVTPELVRYLDEGAVQALVAQRPERIGELAVELQTKKAKGEAIPPLVDTGVKIVRKDDGGGGGGDGANAAPGAAVGKLFAQIGAHTDWKRQRTIALDFDLHHGEGLAKIGDDLWISAVETREPGKGVGHLFHVDADGHKVADVVLGDGDMFHPGGIDFDGALLWVSVAEYEPGGKSIVYAVDPKTGKAEERFRADEHLTFVVHDPAAKVVVGATWGAETFLAFDESGKRVRSRANTGSLVDLQDCQLAGAGRMLCGGLTTVHGPADAGVELGGLALVDLATLDVLHAVPLDRTGAAPGPGAGHALTHNAAALEADDGALLLYAIPGDGRSQIEVWTAR